MQKIESESHKLANSMFDSFIDIAKSNDWSFAYTQFSPGQLRYACDAKKSQ